MKHKRYRFILVSGNIWMAWEWIIIADKKTQKKKMRKRKNIFYTVMVSFSFCFAFLYLFFAHHLFHICSAMLLSTCIRHNKPIITFYCSYLYLTLTKYIFMVWTLNSNSNSNISINKNSAKQSDKNTFILTS